MYPSYERYCALVPYGSLSLTESSPMQTLGDEPLTLAEAYDFLNLPPRSDPESETALITDLIRGARVQAEIAQNQDLVRKQWDKSLDFFGEHRINLRPPLVSVDLVQYRDSDGSIHPMSEGTDYIVDTSRKPGAIVPPFNTLWPCFTPWPAAAVLIRFTSGYLPTSPFWQDTGAIVRKGMRELITQWYHNRIPFELGENKIAEYPYGITACLSAGAVPRVL